MSNTNQTTAAEEPYTPTAAEGVDFAGKITQFGGYLLAAAALYALICWFHWDLANSVMPFLVTGGWIAYIAEKRLVRWGGAALIAGGLYFGFVILLGFNLATLIALLAAGVGVFFLGRHISNSSKTLG
jgi:hypothetical protein